jgi:hypothetical protein
MKPSVASRLDLGKWFSNTPGIRPSCRSSKATIVDRGASCAVFSDLSQHYAVDAVNVGKTKLENLFVLELERRRNRLCQL